MRRHRRCLLALPAAALLISNVGCRRGEPLAPVTSEIGQIRAHHRPESVSTAVWASVQSFYAARHDAPAWVNDRRALDRANDASAALGTAELDGLQAADYLTPTLKDLGARLGSSDLPAMDRARVLANFDVRLTCALLSLGYDIAVGRTSPTVLDPRWKKQRVVPDLAAGLEGAIDTTVTQWLQSLRPPHPEYAALRQALIALRDRAAKGGWPAVPGVTLRPGRSHPAVLALRERLQASGDLSASLGRNVRLYDAEVTAAVKSLQAHNGLPATGVLDEPTAAALNVPLDRRIAQVSLNLERWRWMPNQLGSAYLMINIPSYTLVAYEHLAPVFDIRVVVGKTGNETPVFSDAMTTLVFSPYWNIPDTIVEDETMPAMANDAEYLARNNIEILRTGTHAGPVDPSEIDWTDPEVLGTLSFRQRPGTGNALGRVKFIFPNPYDVYLHDTPANSLFTRLGRTFSHGCIRVEEPETLARYLLRDNPRWTDQEILRAMNAGTEEAVPLARPLPVHIVYFTAWVDANGGLHFQGDPYGYDGRQLRNPSGSAVQLH